MQGLEFEYRRTRHQSKNVDKDAVASLTPPPVKGVVERDCFFGIHTVREYTMSGRRHVNKHYKHPEGREKQVLRYLEENPIVAFPIPLSQDDRDPKEISTGVPSRTAILQGNNRVRYAPGFVEGFPSQLVTPEQASKLLKIDDVGEVYETVGGWMDETLIDFARHNPSMRRPYNSVIDQLDNGLYVVSRAPRENLVFSRDERVLVPA